MARAKAKSAGNKPARKSTPPKQKAAAKKAVAKKPVAKRSATPPRKSRAKPAAKRSATTPRKSRAKPPAKRSATTPKKPRAKPPAKRSATNKPATNRATNQPATKTSAPVIAPPTFHIPSGPARQRLRDALAWIEDFGIECQRLATKEGPLPWEHADTLELVGLERLGTELATTDREAAVCALVLAAQFGFPRALAAGGAELDSMGFRGDEVLDGATVESQLDRCARWVDDPSEPNRQHVEDGFDPGRQLHTWDPDLQPHDTKSYFWYSEVGQLASAAVVKGDGDAASSSYYYWPATVSVGRGLVVAVRGLRSSPDDVPAILRELYAALTA